jgi:phage gpG-like protein
LIQSQITMKVAGADLQAVLLAASNTGVGRAADVFVRRIKDSFVKTSWHNPSPPGGPPGTVTGRLRNSMQKTPPANGATTIGTNEKYAKKQEYGGLIKAKNKKYLTIPVNAEAAQMRANTKDLRTQNLTFRKGPHRGVAFLWRTVKGKNARSQLMFVLKPTVRLPARPFLRPATTNQEWRAYAAKAFAMGFNFEIRKVFKAAAAAGAPAA